MRKIRELEEKINKISRDIGIRCWEKVREDEEGSPPAYFGRKTYKAKYAALSPVQAMDLLLDHLGLEIQKNCPRAYPEFKIIKKIKNN